MTSELPVTDEEWRQRAFDKHCLIALKVADSVKNGKQTSRDIHMICQGIEIAQQTYTDAAISALEQPTPELVEAVARATYLAYMNHPNADWRAVDQCMKEGIWCPQAKAALAAAAKHLKEPTQ